MRMPDRRRSARGVRVRPEAMEQYALDILRGVGVSQENAATLAAALIHADLQGIQTHGMSRLPIYAARLQKGLINGSTVGKVLKRHGSVLTMDGENGIGQVLAVRAMHEARELARKFGVGMVGVRRSNHFGVAGYYCEIAAAADMIGLAFTNSPKGIPPWNGREAYFGTNPIAVGIPVAGRDPIIIDFSTSVVARGNIILAAQSGEPIPTGWAIDEQGCPTTDAKEALRGAVLPMAGPKGYGLAILVEVLAALLTGAAFGPHVRNMYTDWTGGSDIGHLMIAIDPGAFGEADYFLQRVAAMAEEIEAVPPVSGTAGPRLPGTRRHASMRQALRKGIEYPEAVWHELHKLGVEVRVALPPV